MNYFLVLAVLLVGANALPGVEVKSQPKCAWQDWLECAAKVAECAATCDGDACANVNFYDCPACLSCFGTSADQCIKCLSFIKLATMSNTKTIATKPSTALQVKSEPKCGWTDWLECGAKVAECSVTCFDCVDAEFSKCPSCVLCFGSSAEKCISCLKKTHAGIIQDSKALQVRTEPKCAWQDWLECAAKVAECAATCDGDACANVSFYDCPACLSCFGTSADQCIKCLARVKVFAMTPMRK